MKQNIQQHFAVKKAVCLLAAERCEHFAIFICGICVRVKLLATQPMDGDGGSTLPLKSICSSRLEAKIQITSKSLTSISENQMIRRIKMVILLRVMPVRCVTNKFCRSAQNALSSVEN